MLKKNLSVYRDLLSRMSFADLSSLRARSKEYKALCLAIDKEIDMRLSEHELNHNNSIVSFRESETLLVSVAQRY